MQGTPNLRAAWKWKWKWKWNALSAGQGEAKAKRNLAGIEKRLRRAGKAVPQRDVP